MQADYGPEPDTRCQATEEGTGRRCVLKSLTHSGHMFSGPVPGANDNHRGGALPQLSTPLPLQQWWIETALDDYQGFAPKLEEYGAHDLEEHGRMIAAGLADLGLEAEAWGELGCLVYLHGKLARAMEAYRAGRVPSEDTLKDVAVYAQMARAYRERGGLK